MPHIPVEQKPRLDRLMLLAGLVLICVAGVTLMAAPTPTVELELSWQKHWKNYARRCVKIRDQYYTCGTYENQFPSSLGMTTISLRQKSTREVTEQTGSVKIKKNLIKPNEEIDAGARTLPDMKVGSYGSIHSAQVVEILGPDEMMIAAIWLIDPEQVNEARIKEKEKLSRLGLDNADIKLILEWKFAYRDDMLAKMRDRSFRAPIKLRGYSTAGLTKGDRWTGKEGDVQIAIAGHEIGETKSKTRKPPVTLVAIPVISFKTPISEEKEFLEFLKARGFTKESFIAMVEEEKKLNPTDDRLADAMIFTKLEGMPDDKADEKTAPKPRTNTKPSF